MDGMRRNQLMMFLLIFILLLLPVNHLELGLISGVGVSKGGLLLTLILAGNVQGFVEVDDRDLVIAPVLILRSLHQTVVDLLGLVISGIQILGGLHVPLQHLGLLRGHRVKLLLGLLSSLRVGLPLLLL